MRHRIRNTWNHFMLWELKYPRRMLVVALVIVVALIWQASKLPGRLRGGLVSLPDSESDQVLHVTEKEFSKAISFPTILVQEGLGSLDQLDDAWHNSMSAITRVHEVKQVIDMHLGRKIVAEIRINTHSFRDAREMLAALHEQRLPEDCTISENPKVFKDGSIRLSLETDVRSFKEGEARRKALDEILSKVTLPEGSSVDIRVIRHPRRNFAMVETTVENYQQAETLTAKLQQSLYDMDPPLPAGQRVRVTGLPALFYDLNQEAVTAIRKAEMIGIPLCFLLLIWVFGSPTAASLPIMVALVTLAFGSAVMTKVGKVIEISMYVPSVLSMIGLGVGVDYMLILLSRFRECQARHANVDEAVMESMHLTTPTLLGSGFTVAIGFSALVFTPIKLFQAMGIAGIVVILCALTSIFILSPPLMKLTQQYDLTRGIRWILISLIIVALFIGQGITMGVVVAALMLCLIATKRTSWKVLDLIRGEKRPQWAFWRRWTRLVVEHPVVLLISGLTLMILLASPIREITTASLNPDTLPQRLESKRGYNLCKNSFGAGWLMPAVVVIQRPAGMSDEDYLVRETAFIKKLRSMKSTFDAIGASDLMQASNRGFKVEIPREFFVSKSGTNNLVLAMYDGNPMSLDGRQWIEKVRTVSRETWKKEDGFLPNVGGTVASTLDIDNAVRKYLVRTALFCMGTTLVCLAFFYRSLLIPLQAILMNLLSVCGAYGFLTLWFQKGIGHRLIPEVIAPGQGLNSVVILLLFCALFGLSMDYQVFLISRMSEEWRRSHHNKLAVRHGIELTGRVVTGAAAIMVVIFLSFAFVSVQETQQFGAGMAAAITLDATIIRLLIFPSSMLLFGRWNWWWPFGEKKKKV